MARLSIGVPVGSRFEVVFLGDSETPLRIGDTGTLLSVEDGRAHLRVDFHGELDVDPTEIGLRPLLKQTA
jgi:hypothetical protein